jgi:uncharacterized membrane protein
MDIDQPPTAPKNEPQTDSKKDSQKNLTLVIYGLQALSLVIGITWFIAIIINYVKRDDMAGTIYESHFRWQIRTFWGALGLAIIGWATIIILIGFVILGATVLWVIYRIVKGFLNLNDGKPMYQ